LHCSCTANLCALWAHSKGLAFCLPTTPSQGPKNWAFFGPGSKSLGTHLDSFEAFWVLE
jgi:hypothetical protein